MDGVKIQTPTLSVVTLVNDGKKPLPTADFEAPLELRVLEGSSIVRAEVTSTQPKDVEAKITWEKSVVRFVPVLLNPDETITISVLTEGARPAFSPRARVNGVSSVEFIDSTKKAPAWQRSALLLVAAILLFAASDIADASFWGGPKVLYVRNRAALLTKVVCGLGGIVCVIFFAQVAEIGGMWEMLLSLLGTMIVGVAVGTTLNFGAKSAAKSENAP